MAKVMAVARTVFLVFILGYMLTQLPIFALLSNDSQDIEKEAVRRVAAVAWVAIGWIALETAIAWGRVWTEARRAARAAPAAPAGRSAAPPAP